MDILSWLMWVAASVLSLIWSIGWFLHGGWVSTLAQILVLIAIVFFYKYGWQRAPAEIAARLSTAGCYAWGWVRARETAPAGGPRVEVREVVRTIHVKEVGDINFSTFLSLLMFAGLWVVALT